ncbi:MAG: hypothetical protein GWN73_40715, partial [Actinobacteria bacterium]|nr:hypothetical protein [Actinomycetota bacterium]NIS36864.1 hypothetical protein [Actinomycetota bacterium]NIT98955.1 hypothetical protein [Actinomycetota bacterium]NIU71356.1 hypothetical protein [Actinomycetota bacterium]NIV59154.1 hypothetical protein [Actinomycetota bacterium]
AIATGKHFPGHGDTETDSHVALPVIRHDRARMDSVELRPFQEAIDAGMGAIMTAHISVPSLNGGVREPSTLSPLVLTTSCATRWASTASSSPTPWTWAPSRGSTTRGRPRCGRSRPETT